MAWRLPTTGSQNHNFMSLGKGYGSINCRRTEDVGADLVKINAGNNFHDVKFKRKANDLPHSRVHNIVLPLPATVLYHTRVNRTIKDAN